ncbi:hypothetical protein L2E82_05724 [Cichorium intybus]|uniref:Uncharacterized protein n=1 Tax=Cichorium intybus TaxID=13427 RepID=A0ACB9H951_CICIN|nr:hypothetical protein L2E82_05724 [Cichorium intybus]
MSGKSAAVYACAKEQRFEVIEVNTSDWRNGALVKQKFGKAVESHRLKCSVPNHENPDTKNQLKSSDDVIEVIPLSDDEDSKNLWFEIACRKKKAVHKTTTTDDKRLQSTLKRIGVNAISAIEEVNIFKDETVIQFLKPKVQASIAANTWVVSGAPQTKTTLPIWLL